MRTAFGFCLLALCAGAARQPFAADDLWLWHSVSEAQINSEGGLVVYVDRWNDRTRDAAFANLWIAAADGSRQLRLTEGAWRDTSPRWSPDGKRIAYLSDRSGRPQIRIRRLEPSGELEVQTPGSVPLSLAWSPDGDSIAFSARLPAQAPAASWASAALAAILQPPVQGFVHIFVAQAAPGANGASLRQITSGNFDYDGEPAWTPDGQSILAVRDGEGIYALPVRGGSARRLTNDQGRYASPLPSPDGARIAYIVSESKPQSYVLRKLAVMNADGSRVKVLAGALDRDVRLPHWSSDSRTVYFLADNHGRTSVYAARNDGSVRQATHEEAQLHSFSLADNGRAAAAGNNGDVVTFPVDQAGPAVRVASPNEAFLAGREPASLEEIQFESDGKTIQAWLWKPPAFDRTKKYPLLLDIQDAPRRMCEIPFSLREQIYAARGFVVLCVNPRGTPGYGEQFGNLIYSRLPGDDYDDLMRGVDTVVAKGFIDPKRLTVVGGLLAAWTIGHTDRFAAAVARRPIVDWVTHVATSPDGLHRASAWMGSLPWDNPDQYVKRSPIFFAQNFKTPTLVIAGDPDPESDELYFALQARKVDSARVKLVQNGKPSQCLLETEAILAWLGK